MSVTCWYCDVRVFLDPVRFSCGMSLLPWEERREKVMRYYFEIDRCRCLGAGLLLVNALREAGVSDMKLRYLSNGKPVLANEPDVHFNLSHSGNLAVCAVSDHPVGVDVELLQDMDPGVAGMCFQPVDGWKATYTIRSGGMSSWHVEECPKFLRDTTPHDRKVVYD